MTGEGLLIGGGGGGGGALGEICQSDMARVHVVTRSRFRHNHSRECSMAGQCGAYACADPVLPWGAGGARAWNGVDLTWVGRARRV